MSGRPGSFERKKSHRSPARGVSMNTRRRLVLALGLAAIVAFGGYVATAKMRSVAEVPPIKEKEPPRDGRAQFVAALEKEDAKKEQPARERRTQFIEAFNKGDAKAVA